MLKSKKNEFYHRLVFSAIAVSIVGLLVGFAYHPWVHVLLVLTMAVLTGIGVWEYAQLAHNKGIEPATKLMICVALKAAICASINAKAWSGVNAFTSATSMPCTPLELMARS